MKYPVHLAIIPDGCRRWAKLKALPPWEGHKAGIETLKKLGKWSIKNFPIKYYTVYGLSVENLERPSSQLNRLSKMYAEHFLDLAKDTEIHENKVNVGITGRMDLLPKKLQDAIKIAEKATQNYDKRFFRVALAYSGRREIMDSISKILKTKGKVTEKKISSNLYSEFPEPDLILRTAEERLSNFLLWQSAYSELYFLDKFWPDVTKEDYIAALEEFDRRKRRYGR